MFVMSPQDSLAETDNIQSRKNSRRIGRVGKPNKIAQEISSIANHQIQTDECYHTCSVSQ